MKNGNDLQDERIALLQGDGEIIEASAQEAVDTDEELSEVCFSIEPRPFKL